MLSLQLKTAINANRLPSREYLRVRESSSSRLHLSWEWRLVKIIGTSLLPILWCEFVDDAFEGRLGSVLNQQMYTERMQRFQT